MSPQDFHGRDGESWVAALVRFVRFVMSDTVLDVSGDGVRETRTQLGRSLVFEPPAPAFRGSFYVSLTAPKRAQVAPGLVDGQMPRVEGVFLDGTDEEGEPAKTGIPEILLEEGPDARNRSWICLRVIPNEDGDIDPETEETLTVVHVSSLPARLEQEMAPDMLDGDLPDDVEGAGLKPIAQLTWSRDGERVLRSRQVVFFDQGYKLLEADGEGGVRRHRFRPVG